MNKVPLRFKGISEVVGSDNLSLLTLVDETETRQLTVLCDADVAEQFKMRIGGNRPSANMLPEVMCRLMDDFDENNYEIFINGLERGHYKSVIIDKRLWRQVPIRVSEAILLAFITKMNIFVDESLMRRQAVNFTHGATGIAIPVNTLSREMLEEALGKAVDSENYELASQLRDELRRRN